MKNIFRPLFRWTAGGFIDAERKGNISFPRQHQNPSLGRPQFSLVDTSKSSLQPWLSQGGETVLGSLDSKEGGNRSVGAPGQLYQDKKTKARQSTSFSPFISAE